MVSLRPGFGVNVKLGCLLTLEHSSLPIDPGSRWLIGTICWNKSSLFGAGGGLPSKHSVEKGAGWEGQCWAGPSLIKSSSLCDGQETKDPRL